MQVTEAGNSFFTVSLDISVSGFRTVRFYSKRQKSIVLFGKLKTLLYYFTEFIFLYYKVICRSDSDHGIGILLQYPGMFHKQGMEQYCV